jgi:hypothetical protein
LIYRQALSTKIVNHDCLYRGFAAEDAKLGLSGDNSAADNMPSSGATAMQNLTSYSWPGNERELQNVIERALVLAKGSVVEIDSSMLQPEQATEQPSLGTLENVERNHISRSERDSLSHPRQQGNAEILGTSSTFVRASRSWESGDLRIRGEAILVLTGAMPADPCGHELPKFYG